MERGGIKGGVKFTEIMRNIKFVEFLLIKKYLVKKYRLGPSVYTVYKHNHRGTYKRVCAIK